MSADTKRRENKTLPVSGETNRSADFGKWGSSTAFGEKHEAKPSLLLHSCCGPCSTAVVERLVTRFQITIYFCNSNIDDEEEYRKRVNAQKAFVEQYNASIDKVAIIGLIVAPYAPVAFLKLVKGLEDAPEGGARCRVCIEDRLAKTAAFAAMNGYEYFSSTLSVSRHKDYETIRDIGRVLAMRYGISFEDSDHKKGGGEQRSIELSKVYGLYRQTYCGCRFSK